MSVRPTVGEIMLLVLLVVFLVTVRSAAEIGWQLVKADEQTTDATRLFFIFSAIAMCSFVGVQILGGADWRYAIIAIIVAEAMLIVAAKYWPRLNSAEQPK